MTPPLQNEPLGEIHDHDGQLIADLVTDEDAKYIVAAVNACHKAGLTVEQLEGDAIGKLVEALRSAKAALWDSHYGKGLSITYTHAVDKEITDALRPFTPEAK